MQRKIEVVPYDPGWVSEFENEGKRILQALGETVARLHHIGSTAIPGISGRRYYRKNDTSGVRTHQIHAYGVESPEIERHLVFRDYMSDHTDEARSYGELKQSLAMQHPHDIQAYMDGKDAFVKEHLAKAIARRSPQNTNLPR
jgi:GrpB-like predicted nucleotidyltransferase (UPF0157 family)